MAQGICKVLMMLRMRFAERCKYSTIMKVLQVNLTPDNENLTPDNENLTPHSENYTPHTGNSTPDTGNLTPENENWKLYFDNENLTPDAVE